MDGGRSKFLRGLVDNLILYAEHRLRGLVDEVGGADAPFLVYVWHWFLDLCGSRANMTTALTYAEISAWSTLKSIAPRSFELAALRELDVLARSLAAPGKEVDPDVGSEYVNAKGSAPGSSGGLADALRSKIRK